MQEHGFARGKADPKRGSGIVRPGEPVFIPTRIEDDQHTSSSVVTPSSKKGKQEPRDRAKRHSFRKQPTRKSSFIHKDDAEVEVVSFSELKEVSPEAEFVSLFKTIPSGKIEWAMEFIQKLKGVTSADWAAIQKILNKPPSENLRYSNTSPPLVPEAADSPIERVKQLKGGGCGPRVLEHQDMPSWLTDDASHASPPSQTLVTPSQLKPDCKPDFIKSSEELLSSSIEITRKTKQKSEKESFQYYSINNETPGRRGRPNSILPSDEEPPRSAGALKDIEMNDMRSSMQIFNSHHKGRLGEGVLDEVAPEDDEKEEAVELFCIPSMPEGSKLTFNILSTWGDTHYVGLNGIEVFDSDANLISKGKLGVWGSPDSINVLPEYKNDPRCAKNLVNGINNTCDDINSWLAPFSDGRSHFVHLEFPQKVRLGLIKIWNYNKSRIHSFRGSRYVEISFDSIFIFKGEIRKAPGYSGSDFSENIFFCSEEIFIGKLERDDQIKREEEAQNEMKVELDILRLRESFDMQRPSTRGRSTASIGEVVTKSQEANAPTLVDRPFTAASARHRPSLSQDKPSPQSCVSGKSITIEILSSWGDPHFVGLTGIEVLDSYHQTIPISTSSIDAVPRDIATTVHGREADVRRLENILNGRNNTTNKAEMWLTLLRGQTDESPKVVINLSQVSKIGAIKFWNYNPSLDGSFRGVKDIRIFVDSMNVTPNGVTLRKSPGHTNIEFSQTINLSSQPFLSPLSASINNEEIREIIKKSKHFGTDTTSTVLLFPTGYVFKVELLNTHGDLNYVGLNGIQFFDARNQTISLTVANLQAVPRDITVLSQCANDVRTLDKLVDGVNETSDDAHMWLTPFTSGQPSLLYVVFEEPVAISAIAIWNYSKTPTRGAKEFRVYADDIIIYDGVLTKCETGKPPVKQVVIFTNDYKAAKNEKTLSLNSDDMKEQDILFIDNHKEIDDPAMTTPRFVNKGMMMDRPMTTVGRRQT